MDTPVDPQNTPASAVAASAPAQVDPEVQEVLESPLTAKILKTALTWLLSSNDSPVMRRLGAPIRAGIIWLCIQSGAAQNGNDMTAVVEKAVAWITGAGAVITWGLHLIHDRVEPRVEAWIDKKFPPVTKKGQP